VVADAVTDVDPHHALVAAIVAGIDPADDHEARDRRDTLDWIAGGAPLCRTAKPATPPEHLVSYAVVVDPAAGQLLLADHRLAGLWLPTGGHVEPGEHPADTARRELREELGVDAPHLGGVDTPLMVTRRVTQGLTAGHMDVSLWYCFALDRRRPIRHDPGEFHAVRWWSSTDIAHGPTTRFDPNLPRFVAKLASRTRPPG
jgi:8-oxo-dGTP pyrophosphatase MutT (NUDIX family)